MTKIFRTGALDLAIEGRLTNLVGVGLAKLQVEYCRLLGYRFLNKRQYKIAEAAH